MLNDHLYFLYGHKIDHVDNDYIYFNGVHIHNVENSDITIKCSLENYKCEEYKI